MLGDSVERALTAVGLSRERVELWLGETCRGCEERKRRLNAIHAWAIRVLSGRQQNSETYLQQIMGSER